MGLLRGLWNAVDPYLPDEQIMGLLGRRSQPQGLLGDGDYMRLAQRNDIDPSLMPARPAPPAPPPDKATDGRVGFLDTLFEWDGGSWSGTKEKLRQDELMRPMAREIRQGKTQATADVYRNAGAMTPEQRMALGLNPEALGTAYAEGSKPRQFKAKDVNGVIIDENDPEYEGRFIPGLEKGEEPVFNARGEVIGVQNMDGSVTAKAQVAGAVTGAQKGAEAEFDIVEIPVGDRTVRVPRSLALQALYGQHGQPPPARPGAPAPAAPPALPTFPSNFGVSQSAADATYADATAKSASEQYQAIQTAGAAAGGNIAKYRQLGQLFEGVEGNKLAPAGLEIARFANSIGLKIDPNLANTEAAVALANEMALELRNPAGGAGMPGALSDRDREFLLQMVPNLLQSNEGRKKMVEARVAIYEREQDVAGMARKWHQRFGRLDKADATGKTFHDYLGEWAAAHPLFAQ